MADEEPQFTSWKDAWEYESGQARDTCMSMGEDELLAIIKEGKSDQFFQIWSAIGEKGTKEKAPPVLLNYIEQNPEDCMDLTRYHCTESLLKILKIKDKERADYFITNISQLAWPRKSREKFNKTIRELREYLA